MTKFGFRNERKLVKSKFATERNVQDRTAKQEQAMTRAAIKRGTEAEIARLRNTQQNLHEALRMLFRLLEIYSPVWYDKRFHDQAKAALKSVDGSREIR
jgi:hypothetical protein